jgi:predicted nuclease of predicted toxin-antitoxin system
MKFLANENIPKTTVQFLRGKGLDIEWIGEEYQGIKDTEVIHYAIEQGRTIITFDRDYGELIFKDGYVVPSGVIYLRTDIIDPVKISEIVLNLIDSELYQIEGNFTVADGETIRQRRIP